MNLQLFFALLKLLVFASFNSYSFADLQGFIMLMDGYRIEDLQRMYSLFSRVNALESLRQALSSYIRGTGQGIVMDEEKDKDMVSSLLEFKTLLDSIWEESFSKNEAFCNTIKDAFEHLINLRQVSMFCHLYQEIILFLNCNLAVKFYISEVLFVI